jgi:RHS repeat-associated protein
MNLHSTVARVRLSSQAWSTPIAAALSALIVLGGATTARAQSESVEYFHTDAIGSVRLVTDELGVVIEQRDFLPFGEELAPPASAEPLGFAGKERDAETGNGSWVALNYFGARHLHSASGRFTSVDPLVVARAVGQPQLWNRYVYVANNPIRYTDPDGRKIAFEGGDSSDLAKLIKALSGELKAVLALYDGDDEPDLYFSIGPTRGGPDGKEEGNGSFRGDWVFDDAIYAADLTAENLVAIERAGRKFVSGVRLQQNCATIGPGCGSQVVLDLKGIGGSLSEGNRALMRVLAHELGHAKLAAEDPTRYQNLIDQGRYIRNHDRRPQEIYANEFMRRTVP